MTRQYYDPLLEYCDKVVSPGDVVFDCGANQGIFTCAFAAIVGPKGRVVAFEPQDYAVAALRNNLKLNGFDWVQVEHSAVSDEEGSATLDVGEGAVAASITRDYGHTNTVTVRTVLIDDVARRLGLTRLDVLKCDVEGAEYKALLGARSLISRSKPIIVLEIQARDKQWAQINEFLAPLGYKPFNLDDEGALVPVNKIEAFYPCILFLPPAKQPSHNGAKPGS